MQAQFLIKQTGFFKKTFVISGPQEATIKLRGFADTKATAEFNNREWVIKSSFLNDKFSIESAAPTSVSYIFNGNVLTSKGSIVLGENEYIFKVPFMTKKRTFLWLNDREDEVVKFMDVSGFLKSKFAIEVSKTTLDGEKLCILLVLGFFIIQNQYYSIGSGPH
jgi:hypothetical protein